MRRWARAGTRSQTGSPGRGRARHRKRQLDGGRRPGSAHGTAQAQVVAEIDHVVDRRPAACCRVVGRRLTCSLDALGPDARPRTVAPGCAPLTLTPVSRSPSGSTIRSARRRPRRTVPSQQRAVADEAGDEAVGGRLVEPVDRVDLLDRAVVEHRDAVAHRQRLALVVRDVDEGHAELAVQFLQLDLHVLAQLLVQRAQRLVHQHQLRLEHQRARQRHALLLAARELRRVARSPCPSGCTIVQRPGHALAPARPWAPCAPSAGRPRCRPPSGAGTARSSGTPCRSCACAAACA